MERMGVAKASTTQMSGEDLGHAFDAVRVANKSVDGSRCSSRRPEGKTPPLAAVAAAAAAPALPCCELFRAVLVSLSVFVCLCAVRFLEVQLSSQCRQLEEELQAARTLAGRPPSGRPATAQQEVRARTLTHNVWGRVGLFGPCITYYCIIIPPC